MAGLQLSSKLWIADLHDIDHSTRGEELITLTTDNQYLILSQDICCSNSNHCHPPLITMALAEEGYTPKLEELCYVFNARACFPTHYTILAGSYWLNSVESESVTNFYNKYLKDDPAVIDHRKCYNNVEEENENLQDSNCTKKSRSCRDVVKSKWCWSQRCSNFPFLFFTTSEPSISQISLHKRTKLEFIVAWSVFQDNEMIGNAYFLPHGIPDMVGEAGMAVFIDKEKRLKGIFMSEKLRDNFREENNDAYRRAQELCIPEMLENRNDVHNSDGNSKVYFKEEINENEMAVYATEVDVSDRSNDDCISKVHVSTNNNILSSECDEILIPKTHQCEECRKCFDQAWKLRRHMLTHTGQKDFQCEVCCKTFSQNSSLKTHLKTHAAEKEYTCTLCLKQFRRQYYLNTHMLMHKGMKCFECEICTKRFMNRSHLHQHMVTHSAEKKFLCGVCEKTFSRHGDLKRHFLVHSKKSSVTMS